MEETAPYEDRSEYYFKLSDGTLVTKRREGEQPEPEMPDGTVELSQAEYAAEKRALADAYEAHKESVRAAERWINRLKYNSRAYLVAAATAPDHVKAAAAYVCGGADDQVVINEAIAAAVAEGGVDGGTVTLTAGTFVLSGPVAVPSSHGLTLKGDGPGTLIGGDGDAIVFAGSVTGAVIRDLAIACTGYGIRMDHDLYNSDNTISGCRFIEAGLGGILVAGSGHRVTGNTVAGPGGSAIHLIDATGCIVSGNILETAEADNATSSLVRLSGGSHSILISGNVFLQRGTAANGLLYQQSAQYSTVRGNVGVSDS